MDFRSIFNVIKSDAVTPPQGVQASAKRALEWIKDGKAGSGFTNVGRKRASDLANGHPVSLETLKRMKAYFDRHQPDKKAEGFRQGEKGFPSHGRVAWDAWGGDAGYAWAKSMVARSVTKEKKPEWQKLLDKEQKAREAGDNTEADEIHYGVMREYFDTQELAKGDVQGHEFHGNQYQHVPSNLPKKNPKAWAKEISKALIAGKSVSIKGKYLKTYLQYASQQGAKYATADITELGIDGTRLMGKDGLGYARTEMPQISSKVRPQFLEDIKEKFGITSKNEQVDPTTLQPAQKEISAVVAGQKFGRYGGALPDDRPILVSNDNYVVDGNHRWVQAVAGALIDPNLTLPVIRLSCDIQQAIKVGNDWAQANGISAKPLGKAVVEKGDVKGHEFHGNQYEQGTGGSGWKPVMTRAEADEWSKNSAIKGTLYHAFSLQSAKKTGENGFVINRGNSVLDTNKLGHAVYLGLNREKAEAYLPVGGKVLEVAVNVKNVADENEAQNILEYVNKQNPNQPWSVVSKDFTDEVLKRGYDAIKLGSEVAVYDPKNVVVVSNSLNTGEPAYMELYRKNLAEFYGAGGKIERIDNENKMFEVYHEASELTHTPEYRNGDARTQNGITFIAEAAKYASSDARAIGSEPKPEGMIASSLFVARDAQGQLVGAVNVKIDYNPFSSDYPPPRVVVGGYLGSTGQLAGTGSALMEQQIQFAGDHSLPLMYETTKDSTPYHTMLGAEKVPGSFYYGFTAEQAKTIGALPNPDVKVIKGDKAGHDFHGNQWITTGGGFRAKPPARQRQQAPAPAPAQVSAPEPPRRNVIQVKPKKFEIASSINLPKQDYKQFVALTGQKVAKVGGKVDLGGNQQRAMYKVTMDDGSKGIVKEINDWHGISGETMAENEILASKIGMACDFPIRQALPVEGNPEAILQPWVDGERWKELSPVRPTSRIEARTEVAQQPLAEMKFFDALTGNPDRHGGNAMVTGIKEGEFQHVDEALEQTGAKVVGIDHSLCFMSNFPPASDDLGSIAQDFKIPSERIAQIGSGLSDLRNGVYGTLSPNEEYNLMEMQRSMKYAFPNIDWAGKN